jgi:hypothetical protein
MFGFHEGCGRSHDLEGYHGSHVGVVFAAALAIGSLTTSGEDLIDALFGGGGAPTLPEVVFV